MVKFDFTKPYDFREVEENIYSLWEKSGFFNPDNLPGKRIKNYVVYMPLPNITGSLHMGHALDNTLQDILIRYYRMQGLKTLWFPGTDHAGIATQYKVEKDLQKQGISRFELGREKFIEKVWEWKEKYGNIIVEQLKKLGVSADWSRFRFTMDENYSKDVLSAFVHYYKKGWIYKGVRTVNWCPRCGTSLSDLELEYKKEETKLWYIKYPLSSTFFTDTDIKFLTVATTRPETMLGDVAVGVNPRDKRYKKLIGKKVILPLVGREIPIVGDERIDPNFGTGVLKITPAHDVLDFEISSTHKLPIISVIDERGRMNEKSGKFQGLKTEEARKAVLDELKLSGYLVKEEPYTHNVSTCYRCGRQIEPIPSAQWFLKMDKLAKYALLAVKSGKVRIHPKNFEKIYFNWLNNIRDWTISRQLWWGHRLPVWECECRSEDESVGNKFVVAMKKPKKPCPKCRKDYKQVDDVLDTWFSSALWPFAGLSRKDKKKYYPGDALITGRDILNLWVARMIFSGIEFMGKPPFKDVFIHGTVLTKEGKRMSKSLGTGIDPMDFIKNFGADATRFGTIWQAVGQDIRFDESAIMAGKKFNNKLWNAARFVLEQTKEIASTSTNLKVKPKTKNDKLVLGELAKTKKQVKIFVEDFNTAKALKSLYKFFWNVFCDKYIEASKKQLQDEKYSQETKKILLFVLLESLKMLHPFLPFITEAIYQSIISNKKENDLLMVKKW